MLLRQHVIKIKYKRTILVITDKLTVHIRLRGGNE